MLAAGAAHDRAVLAAGQQRARRPSQRVRSRAKNRAWTWGTSSRTASQELWLTRIGMVYGRVWVADEGRAVAVWAVPGQDPSPALAELGPIFGELSGDRAAASAAADAAIAPYRPQEPGWFLGTVGTAPEAQGQGLGSAVLIPGIQEAERAGYPAFLETSSEANVRFYERLGFKVTADVQLPDNGPRTWCMRRDPR